MHSCTTVERMSKNETPDGHYRLYSYPTTHLPIESQQNLKNDQWKKISILSLHDWQNSKDANEYPLNNKTSLKVGGSKAIKAYLKTFQNIYNSSTLFVSAGSFSNLHASLTLRKQLENTLELEPQVIGLGLNEWQHTNKTKKDYVTFLKDQMLIKDKKNKNSIMLSNLISLKTGEEIQDYPFSSFKIINLDGIKIGVISLFSPKITLSIPDENIIGLHFQSLNRKILTHSLNLKKMGADVIIMMIEEGIDCHTKKGEKADLPDLKMNFYPPDSSYCIRTPQSLTETLDQIPADVVDLVISSGPGGKVANFINNIPVVQLPPGAALLSWVDLYFNKNLKKIDSDKTIINQPIALCHQFLKRSEDCYWKEIKSSDELIPAQFLGVPIVLD